ncbi:hypothetical protein [Bradyrhizobium sp. ISRA463]|uniref:hypothetical protein n=1 Tax=Bradyrhizobium sp. ISRA463 TaxID=2866199 RepID=UPI00247A41D1|nr:hypothetical protein [Bradyrhizobium sp. ISRA463]WGS17558.1 hypothetical protein MTX22_23255 [Bradyrhizobium sp. ISRA463]
MLKPDIRIGPRHPRFAAAGYELTRRLSEPAMARLGLHKANGDFAKRTIASIRERLQRGETVYIAGLACPGTHNTGVALVEVTQSGGPRLIVNNEEERFSGKSTPTSFRNMRWTTCASCCGGWVATSATSRPSSRRGTIRR